MPLPPFCPVFPPPLPAVQGMPLVPTAPLPAKRQLVIEACAPEAMYMAPPLVACPADNVRFLSVKLIPAGTTKSWARLLPLIVSVCPAPSSVTLVVTVTALVRTIEQLWVKVTLPPFARAAPARLASSWSRCCPRGRRRSEQTGTNQEKCRDETRPTCPPLTPARVTVPRSLHGFCIGWAEFPFSCLSAFLSDFASSS